MYEKLIDTLVEEFNKNIDGNEKIYNDNKKVWSSCRVYIVLFVIVVLMIIGISSVFIYLHWCLKKVILILIIVLQQQFIKHINGKYLTN